MKNNHTPGPWTLSQKAKELTLIAISDSGDDLKICEFPMGNSSSLDNMRLVLAAPEMFEALKFIGLCIDNEVLIQNPELFLKDPKQGIQSLKAMQMLTVALAKARGE